MPPASTRRPLAARRGRRLLSCAGLLLALACSCSSVSFQRDTESSGTFVATGWAVTLFSVDIPKSALNIARENASDANLPNTVVQEVTVAPYLGAFDFLFDIFCVRHATVRGTWGFSGADAREPEPIR